MDQPENLLDRTVNIFPMDEENADCGAVSNRDSKTSNGSFCILKRQKISENLAKPVHQTKKEVVSTEELILSEISRKRELKMKLKMRNQMFYLKTKENPTSAA